MVWVWLLYSITWLSVFISLLLPIYCTKTQKKAARGGSGDVLGDHPVEVGLGLF